jgi:twitching motility protein PilT
MNKEIEWLCFHLVTENLVAEKHCRAVAHALTEANVEPDLSTFAQVIIDNALCADQDRLQQLVEMAIDEARTLGFPPRSVFEDAAAAGGAGVEDETDEAEMLRRAGGAGRRRQVDEAQAAAEAAAVPVTGPEWLYGWPPLEQAAALDKEQALALLIDFLHKARSLDCSDVHISAGARPFVRRYKQVYLVPDQPVMTSAAAEALNLSPLNEAQRHTFDTTRDLDYSYAITEDDRYRTNVMLQRLGIAGAYRIIDTRIRSLAELGFPDPKVVERLTTYHQGLILLTGPAGCGKSTTMASMVDLINRTRHDHIITVEDPIEVVHRPICCNITQRELNTHTRNFANSLRAALREDPDIIVIGELRDLETIEMAIRSAETGHLVIGTLHTGSAATTMNRVLDVFPANQQAQIRAMTSESLRGVICQQLLPNKDGSGVVMACEIMLATLAVSNLVRDGKTFQLPSVIQTGRNIGMSTMEQSLVDLYMAGKRTYEQTLPLVKSGELVRQMQVKEAARAADATGGTKKRGKWF